MTRPSANAARTLGLVLMAWLAAGCSDEPTPPDDERPCTRAADCEGGVCAPDPAGPHEDLAPLELACAEPADGAAPGEPCEAAGDCANGLCLLAGACADACAADADCGDRERCQDAFARTGDDALQPLTACVSRVDLPGDAEVDVEVREAALSGGSDAVELAGDQAPALFVLEHLDDAYWPDPELPDGGGVRTCRPPLCPDSLRTLGASPVTLWDSSADSSTTPALNPVSVGAHVLVPTVWLPNGSAPLPGNDGLELSVTSELPGDLRVTRLSRAPGSRSGGGLDLNVFYVGALDWVPTGSRGPPELEQALDEVDRIFDQAGLFVREVRQIAVVGALPQTGTTFPDGDPKQGFQFLQGRFGVLAELPALFELSAGAANTAVNLFFVADIESSTGELEGLSGGIPGPFGMHGTGSSGIVFAADMMQGDPDTMGRTLAHELAHFLGLFHISEADGSAHDPLDDTAECRDLNGDGVAAPGECGDGAADNLMFWAKAEGTALSAEQIRVLQQALVLH